MKTLYTNIVKQSALIGSNIQSLVLLLMRYYVASVFLRSGAQKLANWDSTVMLFEYEYSVPLLPPNIAAVLGTVAEIVLPLLILFGIFTRLSTLALFVFNIIAVASYSALTSGSWGIVTALFIPTLSFPTVGFTDHVVWGLMMLVVIAFGAGKASIDYLLCRNS